MNVNELRIYYGGRLNGDLDDALTECVKHFGYKWWASGSTMVGPSVRDLAFEIPPALEPPPVPEYPKSISQESDTFWMQKAYKVANEESTCLSHKCGAVLVLGGFLLASAANGVPPGELVCRELGCARATAASGDKLHLCRAAHAEGWVIANAAATQAGVKGSTMYTTRWPCDFCWMLIALAGIVLVVYAEEYARPVGAPELRVPASVEVRRWSLPVDKDFF